QFGSIREQSWKIHFDSVAVAFGDQTPAQSVKAGLFILREPARLPQRMRARQRRVTAKRNLDLGSEPGQAEAPVLAWDYQSRLGQIHLRRDVPHPFGGPRFVE